MITAKVIEDSISNDGIRLTTLQLCYPRFVHAEFMTHRVFSRNASSSRAIPVAKMIEMVRNDPAMPIHWGQNQPGMQAGGEVSDIPAAISQWRFAASQAADRAEAMMNLGLHKQVANRILEPFQHINVIVTATEWSNFFELRDHDDADPNIHALAVEMKKAMDLSPPDELERGQWHLPYVSREERNDWMLATNGYLPKLSAARCARVSYLTHEGKVPNVTDDLALFDRLVGGRPLHASPIEHQAAPDVFRKEAKFGGYDGWQAPSLHGNFKGWIQYRKLVEGELAL